VDALTEIRVVADQYVPTHVTPHVEAAVAFGLDVTTEPDPFAGDNVPAADAELHGTLAADDHVPVGDEVVLLDGRTVRNLERVQRVRAK
jgi:hypothetical protein